MINTLDDLKKLLVLCRKQGVTELDLGTCKFKLGEMPKETKKSSQLEDEVEVIEVDESDIDKLVGMPGFEGLDPMAFYSSEKSG